MLVANKFDPAYAPLSSDFDTRGGMAQLNHTKLYGTALTLNWIASSDWSLKSITAVRGSQTDTNIDFDTLPEKIADVNAVYKDHQFSQELQANYDAGGVLHGVAGLYYFNGSASGRSTTSSSARRRTARWATRSTAAPAAAWARAAYAGYGDFAWDISPAWSLDVGLRLTRETKTALIQNYGYADETLPHADPA